MKTRIHEDAVSVTCKYLSSISVLFLISLFSETTANQRSSSYRSSYPSGSNYPISYPKNSREVFVVNFELGFFACQVNGSSDFLQVNSLSKLCDGNPDCFSGTDENRDYVHCSSGCSSKCAHGVCLASSATKSECFCDDGYSECDCATPAVNECKYRPCDIFAKCTNTHDSYYCTCMPGFVGDGKSCTDIDECANPKTASLCVPNAECCNVPGSYLCRCQPGFRGNGFEQCIDINECTEQNPCPSGTQCENTPGSYKCSCLLGYTFDARRNQCVDVNECEVVGCASGAKCRNFDGGYECICPDKFVNAYDVKSVCVRVEIYPQTTVAPVQEGCQCGPGAICVLRGYQTQCLCPPGTVGEPANPRTGCFPNYPVPCDPMLCNQNAVCQGMRCVCAMGFQGTPPNCVDINECVPNPCAANAQCFNVMGSYQCRCPSNLRAKNPYDSQDACLGACELKKCGRGAICVERQPGTAYCQCPAGYSGIPEIECVQLECPSNPELVCGRNAVCSISGGIRICTCLPGFVGNPPDSVCRDNDECINNPCAIGAACINTPGSFSCSCPPNTVVRNAFNKKEACKACPPGSQQIGPDECGAVNECLNRNPCGQYGQCVNTQSGYTCNCQDGYTTVNGRCVDINECAANPCAKQAVCTNQPGKYVCTCEDNKSAPNPYDRTSTCRKIISNPCDGFACYLQGSCSSDEGDDSCYCKDGYDGTPDKACELVPSVLPPRTLPPTPRPDKSVLCLYDRCRCAPGFQGRYPNCSAVNECAENPCQPGSCSVSSPGKIICTCPKGYTAENGRCISVNECAGPKAPCLPGSCIPVPGSYRCVCPKNYNNKDGKCVAVNECTDNPDVCSPGSCVSEYGTYRCDCPAGFVFIDGVCGDVDECVYNPCTPGTCKNLVGTYECVCPRGYNRANGQCISIDMCIANPCGSNGVCVGRQGGYQCACINGYTFDGTTCVDLNECAETPTLCQPGTCVNTVGSFVCQCPRGFSFRDGACTDINECVVARPCGAGMRDCVNTIGSYKCSCKPGYQFNGITCVDINECLNSPNPCIPGTCRNTEGSYVCVCPNGYEFSKGACLDINECTTQPCARSAACTNTIGSYECRCPPDMKIGNPFDAAGVCMRANPCNDKKCPDDSVCMAENLAENNRARCVCQDGYMGTPGSCRPSRCQLINCGQYASCLSVPEGGVACLCQPGFRLVANPNNPTCVDINECVESPDVCGSGQCQNTLGSYKCQCAAGFQFDGKTCVDVDECTNQITCSEISGSICINTIGSFECRCPSGLVKSGGKCASVRLCEQKPVCGPGQCIDIPQSYRCSCPNGYQYANGTCIVVNECLLLNPCGPGATCQDLIGRYTCFCPKGFAFDDLTCVDINECVRNPCGTGSRECINTRGSYTCSCQTGYRFNGKTCEDINECVAKANPCDPGQCINLPGSFTCVCPANYELLNGQECIKINQCIYNPCTIGTCIEDMVGGYTCQCPVGYEFGNGMCEDINECVVAPDLCKPGACINTLGSYQCRCPKGFQSLRGGCAAVRQCELPGICGVGVAGAYCRDLPDGTFDCTCPLGYQSVRGSACIEVNECVDNPCSPGSCKNQGGYYICTCPRGYQEVNGKCAAVGCERAACQPNSRCLINERQEITCACAAGFRLGSNGGCVAVNECTDSGRNPCGEVGQCTALQSYEGKYDCLCPTGWQKVGLPPKCTDIDECSLYNPCLIGECVNQKGGYTCKCPLGYQLDNGHCIDVNECAAPNPPCSPGSCRNLEGSYECVCPPGYQSQNGGCADVNECATYNPCQPGQCQEAPGTYRCICPKGWMAKNGNCTEINECVPVNPCGRGTCRKSPGSYSCDCIQGYQFTNGQCTDINECTQLTNPCVMGKCVNTEGSYSCVCPRGFFFNGRFCEDRNECVEFLGNLCPGGGTCINTIGSFRCVCPSGFDLVDGRCINLNTCEYVTCGAKSLPCRDTRDGPLCECPKGHYGDARIACIPAPSCEATRDCGPNTICSTQITESLYKIICTCIPGFEGQPPAVPCEQPCPIGMSKDKSTGICSRAVEVTCLQTSCSPGVCQQPGQSTDNTPPCLCPEGTRYLWDRGVCAIIPPRCGPPNPCLPGQCIPDGMTYKCSCPIGYRYLDDQCIDVNECVENATICGLGGTCKNQPGTYTCQCASGFELRDNVCWDINQCAAPVNPCDPGRCEHTPGSYRCICPDGYRFMPSVGSCSRILTPCIQQKDLCKPGKCEALGENNYRCTCPLGYSFDGVSCIEINECAQNPCGRGQCKNLPGYYVCTCPRGYRNTGQTCEDINECTVSNPCGPGTCQNTEGSYACNCPPGYEFDGSTCIDVNECTARNPPDCGAGQCENTIGSYKCSCAPGFRNGGLLNGPCVDVHECSDNPQPCSPGTCAETSGGYMCQCPPGFQFINGGCVQINVCLIENKCKPGTCALAEGSFLCTCPAGYSSTSSPAKDCIQINECALKPPPCGPGAVNCIDTLGSYQCLCGPGYQLSIDKKLCVDINECSAPVNPCNPGRCQNTPGSYSCNCPLGFSNSTTTACTAINECAAAVNPCLPGNCLDLVGSYQCNCPTGYHFVDGGCADINECAVSSPCRQHGECINTLGSYVCRCDAGYDFVGGTCVDVNECTRVPCAENAQCTNTEGSYTCSCPPGSISMDARTDVCRLIPRNLCLNKSCYQDGTCRSVTRTKIGGISEEACDCIENFTQDKIAGSCRPLYVTACERGFQSIQNGTQFICTNINECASYQNLCLNGRCRDTVGGYTCDCNVGYRISKAPNGDSTCVDINECDVSAPCGQGSCSNTIGSYTCQCYDGFRNVDGTTCVEIKQCTERSPCGQGQCIDTAPGKFICKCPLGYTFDGTTCIDVNECNAPLNPCGVGECINTLGSFVCRCPMGYAFLNSRCVDINECAISNPCAPGECHNTDGSYFCVCPSGYQRQEPGICVDINECARANPCGDGKGICLNTLGSFQCQCLPGFSFDQATKTCISIDECAVTAIATLCLPGECKNTPGSYRCICPAGYESTTDVATACADINECVRNPQLCSPGNCLNTIGSYYCLCPAGFVFANGACGDVNECLEKNVCGSGACKNTIGSYECSCPPGFVFDKVTCVDLNECVVSHPCNIGSCINTVGSFFCVCPVGYEPGPNQDCIDINECTRDPSVCGSGTCVNTIGSYVCRCPIGFSPNRGTCFAINECEATGLCGPGTCIDLVGSYTCQCPTGYEFRQGTCVNINECTRVPGPCPADSICQDNGGSYQCITPPRITTICVQANPCREGTCLDVPPDKYSCSCPPGFKFDGSTCVEINECTLKADICGAGNCINLPGTYLCVCRVGFQPMNGTCVDINECLQNGICGGGRCENTIGSYQCICPIGWESQHGTCVEINECADQTICGAGNSCENVPGSYRCICRTGFKFDGKICSSVNLCIENPDLCKPGTCEPTQGSYRCICPLGYQFLNGSCLDINECLFDGICGLGTCTNTMGSYVCNCPPGYQFTQNSCYDINECTVNPRICGFGTCQNLQGFYQCFCPPGYAFRNGTCVDINECVENINICNKAFCRNTLGSYICECPAGFMIYTELGMLNCRKECAPGMIVVEGVCLLLTTPTPKTTGTTQSDACATVTCGVNEQWVVNSDNCECICIYGGTPPECPGPPTPTTPPKSTLPPIIITTPAVLVPRTEVNLPEASVNCMGDGIEVQVALNSKFQGVLYVKNYSREEECRKVITPNEFQDVVRFGIKYGNCGVNPDGNLAEFVLVIQRHPTLVTVDATAFNVRCVYKPTETKISYGFTVTVQTVQGTIANAAPPPICRITITNLDGSAVNNANIGENLQLKVDVSPHKVYGGFASNCMAVAVDNSWKFQVTDNHGCATDRTIFTEWLTDPTDHSMRANFSAFKFPGASLLRFQCNIRICFNRCPPIICQPGNLQAYGKKKRQANSGNLEDVAPKGDVIEEIQVESSGLQTFDSQAQALNASNGLAGATGSGSDSVCLSATSFGVTLAITLLLAVVAIAISVSCWMMAYRRRPEGDETSYPRSTATGYGNGTQYSRTGRGTGSSSIPRVTVPRSGPNGEPYPDY